MKLDMNQDPLVKLSVAGRNFQEQIADINKEGLIGRPSTLRYFVLRSLGLSQPKEQAENIICFGCYPLFIRLNEIRAYLSLLDRLGIEYSYLEKEYCCGLGLIERTTGAEREQGIIEAKKFIGLNIAGAENQKTRNMVHSCIWCVYIARRLYPQHKLTQKYALDILVDRMPRDSLSVKPLRVGYYEGCHSRGATIAPGVKFDWTGYRGLLEAVKGLEIIDLPKKLCCLTDIDKIAQEIAARKLSAVVCPCNGCASRLKNIKTVQIKSIPEILLEALE